MRKEINKMAITQAPKVMTGARAILRANGKIVAFATQVGYRIIIPHGAVNVLGRYSAARHEPLGYDVTVNCGVMRFTAAGGAGNSADSPGDEIMARVNDIISLEELSIEIIDRATDQKVLLISRARMTERSGNVSARDMLAENWTFVGVIAESSDSPGQQESSAPGTTPPNTQAAS
jgi:hypothetical protein